MVTLKEPLEMIDQISEHKNLIAVAIGSIATVIVAFIGYKGKNNKDDQDDCIKALGEMQKTVIRLENDLEDANSSWKAFKTAFGVVYTEYSMKWKDHPEALGMMNSLNRIIDGKQND